MVSDPSIRFSRPHFNLAREPSHIEHFRWEFSRAVELAFHCKRRELQPGFTSQEEVQPGCTKQKEMQPACTRKSAARLYKRKYSQAVHEEVQPGCTRSAARLYKQRKYSQAVQEEGQFYTAAWLHFLVYSQAVV